MNILIVGECGVGKTWVMTQLLAETKGYKLGKINFHQSASAIVVGKYDGSVFQGSDKLSMTAITDYSKISNRALKYNIPAVWEGDRFTNSTFIEGAKPIIVRIAGDGSGGRMKRGSQQSERQIKAIRTRVSKLEPTHEVENSTECLALINNIINGNT